MRIRKVSASRLDAGARPRGPVAERRTGRGAGSRDVGAARGRRGRPPRRAVPVVRAWLEAWQRGALDEAARFLGSGSVVHPAGGEPPLRGMAELRSWYERRRATAGDVRFDVHDVVGNDRHVVALLRISSGEVDRTRDQVAVYHVEDGLIRSVWLYEAPTPEG